MSFFFKLWADEQGQDIAEYAVMLAAILVVVIGTLRIVGSHTNNVFSAVASSLQRKMSDAAGDVKQAGKCMRFCTGRAVECLSVWRCKAGTSTKCSERKKTLWSGSVEKSRHCVQ